MYVPDHFKQTDLGVALEIVRELRFGMIISVQGNMPIVSHLSLDMVEEGKELYIWGHMARANKQWKTLEKISYWLYFQRLMLIYRLHGIII